MSDGFYVYYVFDEYDDCKSSYGMFKNVEELKKHMMKCDDNICRYEIEYID